MKNASCLPNENLQPNEKATSSGKRYPERKRKCGKPNAQSNWSFTFIRQTNWFLITCGIYYVWLLVHSLVYLSSIIDGSVNHAGFHDLQSDWIRCLSVWNSYMHIFYYSSINVNSLLVYFFSKSSIVERCIRPYQTLLEEAFLSVLFPTTLIVCFIFWYEFFYDRNLIYPQDVETIIPPWFNHCVHTVPVGIVLLHLLLVEPKSPPLRMRSSMIAQSGIHGLYLLYLSYHRFVDGYWLYLFMESHTSSLLLKCLNYPLYVLVIPGLAVWLGHSLYALRWQR